MAVTLRLMRLGKKDKPFYRLVAIEKSKKRNGEYLEKIGIYDPFVKNPLKIDKEKLKYWLNKGAQISKGFRKLLKMKNVSLGN